eukprot:5554782-Amphidinium_carterae.1
MNVIPAQTCPTCHEVLDRHCGHCQECHHRQQTFTRGCLLTRNQPGKGNSPNIQSKRTVKPGKLLFHFPLSRPLAVLAARH